MNTRSRQSRGIEIEDINLESNQQIDQREHVKEQVTNKSQNGISNTTNKTGSTKSIGRKKLELELRTKQKLAKIELEEMQLEMELRRHEQQKEIIKLKQKIDEEDLESGASNCTSVKSLSITKADENVSIRSNQIVGEWLQNIPIEDDNKNTLDIENNDKQDKFLKNKTIYEHNHIVGEISNVFTDVLNKLKADDHSTGRKPIHRKYDLPEFNGDIERWPMFIKMYNKSNQVFNYSNEENLFRLQSCIKGKARDLIYYLLLDAENVEEIIKMLELNFGRPENIINMLIEKARSVPVCKTENLQALLLFSNVLSNVVVTTRNLQREDYLKNPQLLSEFVNKLPAYLKMEWGKYIFENCGERLVDLNDFYKWMKYKMDILMRVDGIGISCMKLERKEAVTIIAQSSKDCQLQTTNIQRKCPVYSSIDHKIYKCEKFKNMDVQDKWNFVKEQKLCIACLCKGHSILECKYKRPCRIAQCKRSHNHLLHFESNLVKDEQGNKTTISEIEKPKDLLQLQENNSKILFRIIPVMLKGPNGEVSCHAILDEGSSLTIMDQEIADTLGLEGKVESLCYKWTHNIERKEEQSRKVKIEIKGIYDNAKYYEIKDVRTSNGLSLPRQTLDVEYLLEKHKYLKYVKNVVQSYTNVKPVILIGQKDIHLTVARKVIDGNIGLSLMATKTLLGWCIHGKNNSGENGNFMYHICEDVQDDLTSIVNKHYELDALGIKQYDRQLLPEEFQAEEILKNTIKYVGDRYEVGLLWKDSNRLPSSWENAFWRLRCMERKMDKNKEFAFKYQEKIDEYISKGFATKLSIAEIENDINNSKMWYLPHFCVMNINKPGKLRFIMDAAAKSSGTSHNDACLKGTDLIKPLLSILWKFRRFKIAFTADVKEMFHQVIIRKEDRIGQRFLWRGMDRERDPDVYEMNVMIFGSISSPYIAQFVKNYNADIWSKDYPEASEAIKDLHYVDDYLDCVRTEEEAVKKIKEVSHIHKHGGFTICNWICSSTQVLDSIPIELRAERKNGSLERVLGVFWESCNDIICFNTKSIDCFKQITSGNQRPTKREMLQIIMSIFDPCGFLANILIVVKIIFQDLWRMKIDWDELISDDIYERWQKWIICLDYINNLSIPRCYFEKKYETVELHIFADASEQAYGTIAYYRIETEQGYEVSFVAAKARVASIEFKTIPKLELQAALLATRLGNSIQGDSGLDITSTTYWSDSKIVLSWISSDARQYKTFVSNRISEITENSSAEQWKWVSTVDNPADLLTRENYCFDKLRWFHGPEFLYRHRSDWQTNNNTPEKTIVEIKKKYDGGFENVLIIARNFNYNEIVGPNIERFSKYLRYVRAIAWMFRFITNCKENKLKRELTYEEIRKAETFMVRSSQKRHFLEDFNRIKNNQILSKKSKLHNLPVKIDNDGLLRIDGRIRNSAVDEDMKDPIIISREDHHLLELLIIHYHEKCEHQGANYVCNEIRQKYFVSRLKNIVKKCIRKCIKCRKLSCVPKQQIMGQLPLARVQSNTLPFANTGVDYFGPIIIRHGRKHEKRYGVLFTCLVLRAVHLEIAENLTTDSAIMAIRRFIARRGQPINMYSDNGTNFQGASKELKQMVNNIETDEILKEMSSRRISWHFNPPAAPHMGGAWERLIRSVKKAMAVSLKEKFPREETLATIFAEIEYTLNNRPLTEISVDYKDPECLTPNHFLIGNSCNIAQMENSVNLRQEWKKNVDTANMFWKRWIKEYLPQLVRRSKWVNGKVNVKVGDVVIIVDDKLTRNTWPMGRVINIFPGADGVIRVVDVKTQYGTLRRPMAKVCVLDVEQNNEQ